MRKRLAATMAAMMVVVAACGNNGGNAPADNAASGNDGAKPTESSKPAETVTIRTTFGTGEISPEQIAEFEAAHPNIKIELEDVDKTKLAAQLATNSAPDVLRIGGVFDLPSYVIRGIALDLTDRIEKSTVIKRDQLLPVANVFRFDGKKIGEGPIYGLPKDWSNDFAIFYNKKAFDAAGVPVPDASQPLTWPEVLDLAKKLTIKEGDKIVQYGLSANEWGKTEPNYNLLMQYLASAGVTVNASDYSSIDFNLPEVKEFISMWTDAVKANIGPNSVNNDQTSGGDLFLANKSAMMINGYWYGGVIRGNEEAIKHIDDFGMLPTPIAPGGKRVAPPGGATGAIINKNSPHPDEAFAFFEWFLGGKPAEDRSKQGWGVPAFSNLLTELPQATEFDKRLKTVLDDESNYSNEFLPVNPYLSDGGWGIFEKYTQPLFFGKSSVDAAVAGMTKDANVVVQEAKNAIK
ncbi:ABC transporter substrate-binding protein [Paenibacillus pasadenensis]|nr:sugar ABC transporter substrate-binding protein [Paenibacillus pasadenensis]